MPLRRGFMCRQAALSTDSGFSRGDICAAVCLYSVTLIIHILILQCATLFNLTPDEYSVTAAAALANGYDWSSTVSTGGYYGYFQSLFYIPAFWLTDDPYVRYKIMLTINGALISFVPLIAYLLLRRKFGVKMAASVLFSAICGFYPCCVLLTKYTWNETMCCLIPWVFMLLMFWAADCRGAVKKQILSALGGLTLAAGYASHGRMLALVAAGAVLVPIVYFTMRKKRVFCFAGFYSVLVAGLACDGFIKAFLQEKLWLVSTQGAPNNTIERMLSGIFSTGSGASAGGISLGKLFSTLVGHLFYFLTSTWGFGAICIVAVIAYLISHFRRTGSARYADGAADSMTVLCWYVLLAMGAIFAVSVVFKSTSSLLGQRMDTIMYGRYTEAFYPLALFVGLVLIYKGRFSVMQCFSALLTGAGINLLTQLVVVPVVLGGERFVSAMVLGLAPLRYNEGIKSLFTQQSFLKFYITTIAILLIWLVIMLLCGAEKRVYPFFAIPLAALLMYSDIYGYVCYTVPQSKNAAASGRNIKQALDLLDGEYSSVAAVNLTRECYTKLQFIYPALDVRLISDATALSAQENIAEICISSREDCLSLCADDIYLIGSSANNICVYAATEEAAQRAKDKGLRVSDAGSVRYTAADLLSSAYASGGSADYQSDDEASVQLAGGIEVYTNYFTAHLTGTYYITIDGSGVSSSAVTVTADKGGAPVELKTVSASDSRLVVSFTVNSRTEGMRVAVSNGMAEPISVSSVTISYVADMD